MKYPSQVNFHTMKSSGNQNLTKPTVEDMKAVFALCRDNHWDDIHRRLEVNPWIALTPMVMVNHISSTVLHQAITSRGNVERRAEVIRLILTMTPQAASIRNGYGSLPLHVIAQRNTKMAARVKENLIGLLIKADPMALLEPGGVGRRTPLHIIFTDYISPRLTQVMIDHGAAACRMRDKKGWLPAHVACSRHGSPEKLHMLLQAYPQALHATTDEGFTLLSLAQSTATESHPNYALIDMLKREMDRSNIVPASEGLLSPTPVGPISHRRSSSPSLIATAISLDLSPNAPSHGQDPVSGIDGTKQSLVPCSVATAPPSSPPVWGSAAMEPLLYQTPSRAPSARPRRIRPRKRQYEQIYDDPVGLLLHLSQSGVEGESEHPDTMLHVEV